MLGPKVIVSVAPLLVDCEQLVVLTELEAMYTTFRKELADIPSDDRLVSPLIALDKFDAMKNLPLQPQKDYFACNVLLVCPGNIICGL